MKTLKVGTMPGLLSEVVVEVGMTVGSVLELANLNPSGYEIKLDGSTVNESATISESSNLLVLVKRIKGNTQTIKIGQMPGLLKEMVIEPGTTVSQAISLAGLTTEGYEIKLDGETVSSNTVISSDANLLVLVRQIKGNTKR